jgi:phosphoribosyl 1,2-cyclic phosphodiesterase
MSLRFASIGSGSGGNAMVIEHKNTSLLLDCGFGLKETLNRLAKIGVDAGRLSGILITHEHEDHARGAFMLARKYSIPLWMSYGTASQLRPRQDMNGCNINLIDIHQPFSIKDILINPFPVPHDAKEPVQFTFSDGHHKLGVLTDLGSSTVHVEAMLNGCHALVLECNHDLEMLMQGPYPKSLKDRVSGRLGHLDNQTSASILSRIDTQRLQHIIAAHLSEKNNRPDLAINALSSALNCDESWIEIASQANGFDWRALS